jgi:hypothetical protein
MTAHPANALFRTIEQIARSGAGADTARDQCAAVANAVGCPNWVGWCDNVSRGTECYCATAARHVVQIERLAGRAS